MKSFTSLLLLWLSGSLLMAQNLVNNPGFESFSSCPIGPSLITNATGWINPDTATPDLYNSCSPGFAGVSVPNNLLGSQAPLSGNGYAGLIATERVALFGCTSFLGSNWREYLQTQLSAPLQAGQTYCVSFYVSLADNVKFATDDLGVHFSTAQVGPFLYDGPLSSAPYNLTPQLVNPLGPLTDAANWTLLQWSYVATGGERFMLIGNFNGDGSTTLINHNCSAINPYAYYYVEDVSVVPGICALPVTFGRLQAENFEDQVILHWETRQESGIERFVIERSESGELFERIGELSPSNRENGSNYQFTDPNPENSSFYRVASRDFDGRIQYSDIVSTQKTTQKDLSVLQTADGSLLILLADIQGGAPLQVFDLSGNMVRSFAPGPAKIRLEKGSLPSGLYFLRQGPLSKKILIP